MDSSINAAARALAQGDPLGALDRVALREDAPGLALRGIAMAQLGELQRAGELLRRAARGFGPGESLARARCITAQTEVALARRELGGSADALAQAIAVLHEHGDRLNATHAQLLELRWMLLLGRIDDAERKHAALALRGAPPMLEALGQWVAADIAVRRVRAREATAALALARTAAARAGIAALTAEIDGACDRLQQPAARVIGPDGERPVRLVEIEDIVDSPMVVVDACRRTVSRKPTTHTLARRPVLFGLVMALARAWPRDVARERLLEEVFDAATVNESWRVRLRVEIGRLRRALGGVAGIDATASGFVLRPMDDVTVVVLAPPVPGDNAAVMALLADGAPWSTSALALALGVSQRSIQRALSALEQAGRVRALGQGRARRWLAPASSGFTTALLLPTVGAGR